jgi:hypothetical protein
VCVCDVCVCACVCGKRGRYVDPVKGVEGGVFCREHKAYTHMYS